MIHIGVDVDDVAIASFPVVLEELNRKFDKKFVSRDLKSYKISELYGVDEKVIRDVYRALYQAGVFLRFPPVEGAREAIRKLSFNRRLSAITSRPLYTRDHTLISLDRNFQSDLGDCYFTSHPEDLREVDDGTIHETKAEVCLREGIDVLIDDCLEHALECKRAGIRALLFDLHGEYGWNRIIDPNNENIVERVLSWEDVLKKLS